MSDESSIDQLRDRLYSSSGVHRKDRHALHKDAPSGLPTRFEDLPPPVKKKKRVSGLVYFLTFSVFFFIGALLLAGYFFFSDTRAVSPDNISIEFRAPTTIPGGEVLPLSIVIINRNPVPITFADLTVSFPEGTRDAQDVIKPFPRYTESLGEIPAGARVERTVRSVLFGEEGAVISIPVSIEYRVESSNAIYEKQSEYELVVSSAPIAVVVKTLEEVVSGQDVTFTITTRSNAATRIDNVLVTAEYPFGFSYKTSSVPATVSGTVWSIGSLNPGEERSFTMTGSLTGQDGEARVFRFLGGTASPGAPSVLGVTYMTSKTEIRVTRPFIGVRFALNGNETNSFVAGAGNRVQGTIVWTNNLSSRVFDGEIEVALSGTAFDRNQVSVERGFFRSVDNTIVFNRDTNPELRTIEPGQSGTVSFSLTPLSGADFSILRNPTINFNLSVAGRRVGESSVPERVESTLSRNVPVASVLSASAESLRTTGSFVNTGPWPPKPDTETTYTIKLVAQNSVNELADTVLTAELPSYVRFTGSVQPSSSGLTYNAVTRQVRWTLGNMSAGQTQIVEFQVAFLPSLSQVDTSPVLVNALRIAGYDRFARTAVTVNLPVITIETPNDPAYQRAFGSVSR